MPLLCHGSRAVPIGFGEWEAVERPDPLSELIYEGFVVDLSPRRPWGMGPLPIPYPWIEEWMDRQGFQNPDLRHEVKLCFYALEEVELELLRESLKNKDKGGG